MAVQAVSIGRTGYKTLSHTPADARRILLSGYVQGVGFRPFVYRIALQYQLKGWVQNQLGRVAILAQGESAAVDAFAKDLLDQAPPLSRPEIISNEPAALAELDGFSIIASSKTSDAQIFVPPDYFACDDCLAELTDRSDRRYRYPFINCTQCGPRYTLIRSMPYDRPNTTMATFKLCIPCQAEYEDPLNRRFHAEPVACPECGPQLRFHAPDDQFVANAAAALDAAIEILKAGKILAVKGIGGYHLMCDARSDFAVTRLRSRKRRPDKPLAVMFPTVGADGLDTLRREVVVVDTEVAMILCGPMRPIVLLTKRQGSGLSKHIAPELRELGVFLPYSPLHHLLLEGFGQPLVATSGNMSGEPVLTDNAEIEERLAHIVDGFLHHDRPISRPADDPVFRPINKQPRAIRLGRGYAPVELHLAVPQPRPILAIGAHLKNTIALSWHDRVVISPHIGDMDTPRSLSTFEQIVEDLQRLYGVQVEAVVCDAHPGYTTHRWAYRTGLPVIEVFHHFAHASALVGEYGLEEDCLVFTWDGAGYGQDGTLWGGETLLGAPGRWRRVASMRPFFLPGGEKAGREPWRSAAALCWETGRVWRKSTDPDSLVQQAWQRRLNCPQTTAAGRLFDAAAAIVTGIHKTSYEGQAPMKLEALCNGDGRVIPMPLEQDECSLLRANWEPLIHHLFDGKRSVGERATDFHRSLAQTIVDQACVFRATHHIQRVGLCGGVFQNRVLTEQASALLETEGFSVVLATTVPCNDAAICYGQVIEHAAVNHV